MKKLILFLTAFMATVASAALLDVKVPQQALASPPTWTDHVVPFEEYEKSTQDFGNTEGRLAVAIRDLGLKQVAAPKQPFNEQHHEPGGTFYDLIGFRHIHGEHNYAYRYKKTPPHHRFLDPRFMGDEYRIIKEYHETGNTEILKDWWAKE